MSLRTRHPLAVNVSRRNMQTHGLSAATVGTTMMKRYALATRIWSAVTCHRFCRFGDLSPKQGRVQRSGRFGHLPAFDGDKSPAKSADKSAHSISLWLRLRRTRSYAS